MLLGVRAERAQRVRVVSCFGKRNTPAPLTTRTLKRPSTFVAPNSLGLLMIWGAHGTTCGVQKWPHGGPWKGQAGVSSSHLVCDLGVCVGFCLGQRNRCAGSSADWPFSAGMTNEAPLSCCLASHCSKASRNGNSQWRVLRYLHLQQVPLPPPPARARRWGRGEGAPPLRWAHVTTQMFVWLGTEQRAVVVFLPVQQPPATGKGTARKMLERLLCLRLAAWCVVLACCHRQIGCAVF